MRETELKLISLNIEKDKHLEETLAFFRSSRAEVICLQEVYKRDFFMFKSELGMDGIFSPMTMYPLEEGCPVIGAAVLTSLEVASDFRSDYYYKHPKGTQKFVPGDQRTVDRGLLWGMVKKDGVNFTVGTTHFTWTPDGEADEKQREDVQSLLNILGKMPEVIFCGDLNAPRGKEIFSAIAERYIDHIPAEYTTSIDGNLHKKGQLGLMVDCLFSTPEYETRNVKLICGLSDHCAVFASVIKYNQ